MLQLQIIYWRKKSRISWLKDGDSIPDFFHKATICHWASNLIKEIKSANGRNIKSTKDISEHLFNYFYDRWRLSTACSPVGDLDMIPELVTEEDNEGLCAPVTDWEIKKVVSSMALDKAPGPDGLLVEFYQRYWELIRCMSRQQSSFSLRLGGRRIAGRLLL